MAKKSKKVEFKGWDWSELGPVLLNRSYAYYSKLYDDCFKCDETMLKDLREALSLMMWKVADSRKEVRAKGLKEIETKLNHIRNFVKAVAECEGEGGYRYSLVNGLYNTEDAYTFLCYTSILLESLWT